jgi:hypothetical protein
MPTAEQIQHMLWGAVSTALYALPWLLGGAGALAFLSYGPIGRTLRRLARSRDLETAALTNLAAGMADLHALVEQIAERQDFMERTLGQEAVRLQHLRQEAVPPKAVTPH